MTEFWQLISVLKQQMSEAVSRTDVLRPLTWIVGLFLLGIVGLVSVHADMWIIVGAGLLLILTVFIYLGSYLYCLLFDRDALRSERYSLNKMAIQQGLRGDNVTGLFDPADTVDSIESGAKQIEHKS
jgi:hypothetical protein